MLCVKIIPYPIDHFAYLQISLVVRGITRGNLSVPGNWLDLSNMLYELNPCVLYTCCFSQFSKSWLYSMFKGPHILLCPHLKFPMKMFVWCLFIYLVHSFSVISFISLSCFYYVLIYVNVLCFNFHIFSSSCVSVLVTPENTFFPCSLYHFTPFLCFRCCICLI